MNDLLPTNEDCREAMESAFESHYEGDWIDDVSEDDMRDVMRRVWSIMQAVRDENGDTYTREQKYAEIWMIIDKSAIAHSKVYSENSWSNFLGDA
jgi:hypothetical protein